MHFGVKDRRVLLGAAALAVFGVVGFFYLQSATGASADQMRHAETECVRWFSKDYDLGGYDAFSSDIWAKDGSVVVEVGFDRRGSSYSTRLCVYDLEASRMSAPNNFTRGRWEK